mgnify:CR=1 FL=1
MKWHREVITASRQVYTPPIYRITTMVTAVILFSLNSLIRNYRLLVHDFSLSLVFSLIKGTLTSLPPYAIITLILTSILGGIVVAFSTFIIGRQLALGISTSFTGIIVSVFAPACPACALSLLSIVGLGGFLAVLPFKGIELGVLGIVILLSSLIYLSKKINATVCEVKQ